MSANECPTPAVPSEAISEPPSPKRILVPIDFSRPSIDALRHARELADSHAQFITLNIIEDPGSFRTLDAVGQRRARHKLRACQLQELADRELGSQMPASIEIREGNPSAEIARLASQRHVDLIVVGRHGHPGLRTGARDVPPASSRAKHRARSRRVIEEAQCSLMVVHQEAP